MNNCFIILAAGQSKRFKSIIPKQYISYKNKPIFEHSLDKILKSKLFKHVILVTNNKSYIKKKYLSKIKILKGGKERGKDYNHSSFCDLILSDLLGIKLGIDNIIEISPLIPENWDWFAVDNIYYQGKSLSLVWDKTGKKYLQVNNTNNNYIEFNDKCSKNSGNIIYSGNNYKLCNPFILKLLCENNRNCKSIVQSHDPNYCVLTDKDNVGGDETSLKYCEGNTYFKQEIENGYIKKNNFSDIVKFDVLKNNGISNWQLIKIGEL